MRVNLFRLIIKRCLSCTQTLKSDLKILPINEVNEKVLSKPEDVCAAKYSTKCQYKCFDEEREIENLSVQYLHTDVEWPDFDKYREESTYPKNKKGLDTLDGRRIKSELVTFATNVIALYGAKTLILHYVKYLSASAEVLALAKIEVKLSEIPEGKTAVFKWRGKPLFVKHRTQEEIDTESATPVSVLRDPESDSARCKDPNWLVVIGVCTHLGCIPIPNQGDYPGGYYCPCHGSHYDAAGRIRKGPAPLNLEIPEHVFIDSNILVVG